MSDPTDPRPEQPEGPTSDDTRPIPSPPPSPAPHGDREDTSVLADGWYAQPPAPPAIPAQRKGGRGLGVGVLLGALVLGAGGGFGGAAAYDLLDDDSAAGATTQGEVRNSTVSTRPDTPAPEGSAEAVAAQVLPSVVKINVRGTGSGDPLIPGSVPGGSGSGIILSSDGEILTNEHVVSLAAEGGDVSVSFSDGTTAPAEIIGVDPVVDLAVIKAEGVSDLQPATIGNSDDLDVGEQVVAIGSPYGLQATVTSGIVSALNRAVQVGDGDDDGSTTYPAIQTDAAINPGNSGGPLVNLAGEVVGVNSSIRTTGSVLGGEGGSIGLGFAIPITRVLPIVEQLRNGEEPTHARLGVTVSDASSPGGDPLVNGAVVEEVNAGSAAEEAGLEKGDIVVRVEDYPIPGVESLVATIRGYRPGDEVELTIVRDGERQTVTATLESDAE